MVARVLHRWGNRKAVGVKNLALNILEDGEKMREFDKGLLVANPILAAFLFQ